MPLYKYLAPERTDILKNGFIRFTQPSAFNDPFETFPCFTNGLTDERIQESLSKHKIGKQELEEMLKAKLEANISKYPGARVPPFELIKELPFVKNMLDQVNPITDSLFKQFMSGEGEFFSNHIVRSFLEAINAEFGVLCLTEKRNNLLMWAHYSASHSGFVVEFDEKHQFFDRREKPEELGRYLKKVRYTEVRPQTVLFEKNLKQDNNRNVWADTFFFSKSAHWAYEEEWRMVEYIRECQNIVSVEPHNIYLFPVPMDCITGIIFGCRTLDTTKSIIKHLMHTNPACSHIRLSEAVIDKKDYKLNFITIT